jgi:TRAP-type mannitol/chloroaromatic compound transport system permease small subunit
MLAVIRTLDAISKWSGLATAWLIVPLILALTYEVIARYFFDAPTVWAYDVTFMLYGAHYMLGSAFTLLMKSHIRTDSFYGRWSPRVQGIVDAVCYLVLFFPAMLALLWLCWTFFDRSWAQGERVVSSPWMPVIYPLKGVLFVSVLLLVMQGFSEFLKSLWAAKTGEWPQ